MTEDELILEEHKNNKALEETEKELERYENRWGHVLAMINPITGSPKIEGGKIVLYDTTFPTESELVELLERRERGKKYAQYLAIQRHKLGL